MLTWLRVWLHSLWSGHQVYEECSVISYDLCDPIQCIGQHVYRCHGCERRWFM